ncbi:phosphatidylserine decarboxylase protein [Wolfiporia cocos MD-104 SS10]|uniref:Phosphatidylserine decarboxylase protein n=1 Tax=Wolfiporia cocos (strain MD-104) TaxID=742152 RepID=A0A2H3JU63_WOLCO|nr:phosphatidylserine decarboxylase protein [Wolfiporia cocos MD-104 SS10]
MPPHYSDVPYRVGGWLPRDQRILERWLAKRIAAVEERWRRADESLHPVIQEFQALIEGDPIIYMGFHEMFEQVPTKPPYNNDPTGKPQVRDYKLMLYLFDDILTLAPAYEDNALVGFPINAILDWPMGTPAGYSMFTNEKVNVMFKKMFDVWVTSPDSRYVLTTADNGWFGPAASTAIPDFIQMFICDPEAQYYGFKSWDDFFVRLFRPGVRPIRGPGDEFITSACESTIYKIASNVQERDSFWLKEQPYSLVDMLHYDELVPQFVGGTVYQAFLSATNYHRWHAPVTGTIEKVVNVPGTYYAESPAVGMDPTAPDLSQSFITAMAARALIFIRADYAPIGLMCFVGVGMSEVSTCEVTVSVGQKVQKGDEIGMFHFGGSTHCLIFRPETKLIFNADYDIGSKVLLNAIVAVVDTA